MRLYINFEKCEVFVLDLNRLNPIANFVENRLRAVAAQNSDAEHDAEYRWQHTLRVASYGKQIATAESAQVELVIAACLLHDVASFDPGDRKEHGRLGAAIIRPLLPEWGYSPTETENICYSVASHVDIEQMETLEAKCVSDADNVDRFGAFRALMWTAPRMNDYEKMIEVLRERLPRLEDYRQRDILETPTGRALFNQQLDLQINFFKALLAEKDLTVLPNL